MEKRQEDQNLEYKDFSKCIKSESTIKGVKSKLFKEISAMANSGGGKIIVGVDDETLIKIEQPQFIIDLLKNDTLCRFINDISDKLVNLTSTEDNRVVTIFVSSTQEVIAAAKDAKGIHKGDVFIRENSEAKKASSKQVAELLRKFSKISVSNKLKVLRQIVKEKIANGRNSTADLNIFDSMAITLSSPSEKVVSELETLFDSNMLNQFMFSFTLPLSRHTTQNMYNIATTRVLRNNPVENIDVVNKQQILQTYESTPNAVKSLIEGWREVALNSESFNAYIEDYQNRQKEDKNRDTQ